MQPVREFFCTFQYQSISIKCNKHKQCCNTNRNIEGSFTADMHKARHKARSNVSNKDLLCL